MWNIDQDSGLSYRQPRSQIIYKCAVSVPPQHQQAPISTCGLLRTSPLHPKPPGGFVHWPQWRQQGDCVRISKRNSSLTFLRIPSASCKAARWPRLGVSPASSSSLSPTGKQACIHAWAIYHVVEMASTSSV